MKKNLLTIVSCVLFAMSSYAQDSTRAEIGTPSEIKKETKEAQAEDKSLDKIKISELKEIITKMLDEKDAERITTGEFCSDGIGEVIPTWKFENNGYRRILGVFKKGKFKRVLDNNKDFILDSVEISIVDGVAREINVYTHNTATNKKAKFTNKESPISVPYLEDRYGDILYSPYSQNYIRVGDVLTYNPTTGKNYVPDDVTFSMKSGKACRKLELNPNINFLINARIYTDLLGIISDEPNGLTQTDLSMRIITNTQNYRNSGWIWWNYLKIGASLARFDSKFKTVTSEADSTITRQSLNQRAWGNVSAELNIFRRWLFKKSASYMGVNGIVSGYWAKVAYPDADTSNIFMPTYGGKVFCELKPLDNMGIEASLSYLTQRISANEWIKNDGYSQFLRTEVTVYYNTFGNPNSRIYVRFSNTNNFDEKRKEYQQLQLGYTVTLNQAFGRGNK